MYTRLAALHHPIVPVKHLKSSWEVFIGQLVRIRDGAHTVYTATYMKLELRVHYSCVICSELQGQPSFAGQ